jgi:hypothetical protein
MVRVAQVSQTARDAVPLWPALRDLAWRRQVLAEELLAHALASSVLAPQSAAWHLVMVPKDQQEAR